MKTDPMGTMITVHQVMKTDPTEILKCGYEDRCNGNNAWCRGVMRTDPMGTMPGVEEL